MDVIQNMKRGILSNTRTSDRDGRNAIKLGLKYLVKVNGQDETVPVNTGNFLIQLGPSGQILEGT